MKYIWTLWWQGETYAPSLVKTCLESMRRNANGAELIILDKDNYSNYITLPKHIVAKFMENKITITHLSDILRMKLLYEYGGLWLDATIFVTKPIPDAIFQMDFYSVRYQEENESYVANNRWTLFLMGSVKKNPMLKKANILLSEYWKINESLVTYLFLDYLLNELYDSEKEFRSMVNSIPYYSGDIYTMVSNLNVKATQIVVSEFPLFNKLNWKGEYFPEVNGEQTLFSQITSGCVETNRIESKPEYSKLWKLIQCVKSDFEISRMKAFGLKLCILSFLGNCIRKGTLGKYFKKCHSDCIIAYVHNLYQQLVNDGRIEM